VPKLAETAGEPVVGLTRHLPLLPADAVAHWVQGDLGSAADCRQFVRSAKVIVHLAHSTTPLTSDRNLPADIQLNLVPTLNLLQAIRDAGTVPFVVFASSGGAVYGAVQPGKPVSESSVCRPASSYGIVKLAVEQYLRVAAEQGWLRAVALRIGNPYGVLLPTERTQGFIGVALNRIVHGQPVRVFGNPNNVRDYIHLQDVASCVLRVLSLPSKFAVYNVGGGQGRSVLDILRLLGEMTGLPVQSETEQPSDAAWALPSWIVLDIRKARLELDWSPKVDFDEGLRVLCRQAQCTVLK
jgi:UDP-glucose 4-epimerase